MSYDIVSEIQKLKKEKDIAILAHYYEEGDIQDIADYVGDSYYLAQMGQSVTNKTILLSGVVFMAESVKILSPEKKVIVPDLAAGCSLVEASPYQKYLQWRRAYPEALAVTYINSSAEVKSISDVIITSSNAEKIISTIPQGRKILFGPDQHLGRWLEKKLNRKFELWPGACEVHILFNAKKLHELILKNSDAIVLAHPECDDAVLQFANVVGSTSRMLEEVIKNPAKKFIVATETGIFHQMQKKRPDVELIQAPMANETCGCNNCPYMKLNTLEKIKRAMVTLSPEIQIEEALRKKAIVSLERMMRASAGENIQWPNRFNEY